MAEAAATASRWAGFNRRSALIAVIALLTLLAVSGLTGRSAPAPAAPAASATADVPAPVTANEDLNLYAAIVARVADGEGYYRAAADELRTNDYPLKPFVAFRLPTLAQAAANLGRPIMLALQFALFAVMVWAWWRRLDGQFSDQRRRVSGAMLAAAGVAVAFSGRYVDLHEVWSGALVATSLALWRRDRWVWSIALGAVAVAIRELALPYLLLMAVLAAFRRDWREAGAWTVVVLLFACALAWHAQQVASVVLPGDPVSPGWTSFGGWQGFVRTYHLAGPLRWLPAMIAAPLIVLTLFGWLSWNSRTGTAATLLFAGYGAAFMLFGRANNFYWGLMVAPAFLVGLSFVPRAVADLAAALERRSD